MSKLFNWKVISCNPSQPFHNLKPASIKFKSLERGQIKIYEVSAKPMPLLESLITSYVNEKATTCLLKYNPDVDILISRIQVSRNTDEQSIEGIIQEMEIERIKYFAKEYILTRLDKINRNIYHSEDNMSSREVKYYRKYLQVVEKQNITKEKREGAAEYVGFYCVKELKSIKIDGDVTEVYEGDFFVAKLDDIKEYVDEGRVVLV